MADDGRRGSRHANERSILNPSDAFFATAPAPLAAKRWALAICIASFVVFCALIPFARVSLPRIDAFVPTYDSIFALNNLLTAGGLLVGFSRSRLRGVLVLASGYLFISLLALPHMLTFLGLLSSSGSIGAGPQTSAWLEMFRLGSFPIFVICYALLKRRETAGAGARADTRALVTSAAAGAVAGACLVTFPARSCPRDCDGSRVNTGSRRDPPVSWPPPAEAGGV